MKILLASLPAYMTATGWATLLAGPVGLLVSVAVLAPFTILGVVVLEAQREKHRHYDQMSGIQRVRVRRSEMAVCRPGKPIEVIPRRSHVIDR